LQPLWNRCARKCAGSKAVGGKKTKRGGTKKQLPPDRRDKKVRMWFDRRRQGGGDKESGIQGVGGGGGSRSKTLTRIGRPRFSLHCTNGAMTRGGGSARGQRGEKNAAREHKTKKRKREGGK